MHLNGHIQLVIATIYAACYFQHCVSSTAYIGYFIAVTKQTRPRPSRNDLCNHPPGFTINQSMLCLPVHQRKGVCTEDGRLYENDHSDLCLLKTGECFHIIDNKLTFENTEEAINQWTIQRNWSNGVHKAQDKDKPMDNPEKLVKWGTQNTRQR